MLARSKKSETVERKKESEKERKKECSALKTEAADFLSTLYTGARIGQQAHTHTRLQAAANPADLVKQKKRKKSVIQRKK